MPHFGLRMLPDDVGWSIVGGEMKRLLFALMAAAPALAGGIGTATAADVAPYYRAPPVLVPYYNWNGFYIGANVGGAWSNNDALWSPLPASAAFGIFPIAGNIDASSAIGGFQAGYNWQFAPTWAVGLEGDWSWAKTGLSFSQPWVTNPGSLPVPGSFTTMSSTLDWVSSLRARLEWMIANNWLLRGEYLYYSLDNSPSVVVTPAIPGALPSGYSWSNANVSVARAALSDKF
jgi:hypothetical protein